jgi:hypothetical protein
MLAWAANPIAADEVSQGRRISSRPSENGYSKSGGYFWTASDLPAFGAALPCVVPAPAAFGDAGAEFAGALDPPPLLSAGMFRLEAPAPGAPPVPDELMLDPVWDAPDPLCAPAEEVVIRTATSAATVGRFMSLLHKGQNMQLHLECITWSKSGAADPPVVTAANAESAYSSAALGTGGCRAVAAAGSRPCELARRRRSLTQGRIRTLTRGSRKSIARSCGAGSEDVSARPA